MGLQELKAEAVKLSSQERLELVSTIVKSLQNAPVDRGDRSAAINKMRGLLKTDRPAPTDEEVSAMLDRRRAEKYL